MIITNLIWNRRKHRLGVIFQEQLFLLSHLLKWENDHDRVGEPTGYIYGSVKDQVQFTQLTAETISQIPYWLQEIKNLEDFLLKEHILMEWCLPIETNEVEFLPPCNPVVSFRDFYAFEAHVKTARAARGLEMVPEWYGFPVFYFSNPRCIIAHEEPLTLPTHGKCLDYELEVAAIIGTECRDVPADDAESVIAGYTILNDWSLRDLQREEVKVGLGPAKGKDFATSLGPYLVTPDELERRRSGKGYDLGMVARVNGVELSRGNWKDIHYSFGEMIARASEGVTLFPGEVIGSGTVGTGCILELGADVVAKKLGRENGWLQAGDTVELEVEGLGLLRNEVVSSLQLAVRRK